MQDVDLATETAIINNLDP